MSLTIRRLPALIRLLKISNQKGQGLVEYALILVLVAIVVIGVLLLLGPKVSDVYAGVVCRLDLGSDIVDVQISGTAPAVTVTVHTRRATTITITGGATGGGACSQGPCVYNLTVPTHGSFQVTGTNSCIFNHSW